MAEATPNGAQAPTQGTSETPAPTPANGAPAKPPPKAETSSATPPELFELVVKGKPLKLTKEQILARAQKSEAAEETMREARAAIRQSEELFAQFQEDPEAVLAKFGLDPDKILSRHVEKKAKEAALTPEEREKQRIERELQEKTAKLEAFEKEKREAAQKEIDERTWNQLEETFIAKAEEHGLPKSPATLQMMAEVAMEALDYGYALTPDQICHEVLFRQKQHLRERDERLLKHMSADQLIEYIGPERFAQMQQASLKRAPPPGKAKKAETPAPAKRPEKGYISPSEFLKKYSK